MHKYHRCNICEIVHGTTGLYSPCKGTSDALLMSVLEISSYVNLRPKPTSLVVVFTAFAGWSWRLELEWCERKILLGWLELVAGVV